MSWAEILRIPTMKRLRDPRFTCLVISALTFIIGVSFVFRPEAIRGQTDLLSAIITLAAGIVGVATVLSDRAVWHWKTAGLLLVLAYASRAVAWVVAVVQFGERGWIQVTRIAMAALIAFIVDRLWMRWVLPTMGAEVRA